MALSAGTAEVRKDTVQSFPPPRRENHAPVGSSARRDELNYIRPHSRWIRYLALQET